MNEDQIREEKDDSPPHPTQFAAADSLAQLDTQKKKELADAVNNLLRGIPLIGPYIVIIKLKWGWGGIVLLFAGFLTATILIATGFYPERAVSERYKGQTSAPLVSGYELRSQDDIKWDTILKSAENRICASGVALTKLNPQLITDRVRSSTRLVANLIYVDPCGQTVKKREEDERNKNAAINITNMISRFANFTRDFTPAQRQRLNVATTNTYPTMVVVIVDNDLYSYFCPYGAVCSNSPVLVFKGYDKNPSAKFFEDNFLEISKQATPILNLNQPCAADAAPVIAPSPGLSPTPSP